MHVLRFQYAVGKLTLFGSESVHFQCLVPDGRRLPAVSASRTLEAPNLRCAHLGSLVLSGLRREAEIQPQAPTAHRCIGHSSDTWHIVFSGVRRSNQKAVPTRSRYTRDLRRLPDGLDHDPSCRSAIRREDSHRRIRIGSLSPMRLRPHRSDRNTLPRVQ